MADARLADCHDEDAMELTAIEIGFGLKAFVTQSQQQRLLDWIEDVVSSPCNQLAGGVHWVAEIGARPSFSKRDAAFLGREAAPDAPETGEPTFDDDVFSVRSSAREFLNEEERQREDRARIRYGQVGEGLRNELAELEMRADDPASLLGHLRALVGRVVGVCSGSLMGSMKPFRRGDVKRLASDIELLAYVLRVGARRMP